MSLPVGTLLAFHKNPFSETEETEFTPMPADEVFGEPLGEDYYHIYMLEHSGNVHRQTVTTMNDVVRFLSPIDYVKNLLKNRFDGIGFILRCSENSAEIFAEYIKQLDGIRDYTNDLKKKVIADYYESQNLHST